MEIFGTDYDTPDGTCIRDYIHIVDLAQAHMLALQRSESSIYNLGNGQGYSVLQVLNATRKITGKEIASVNKPRRPGDASHLISSSHRVTRDLGWVPKYPRIEQIVESAWNWHKAHPDGYLD